MADTANSVYRDFNTDGIPASGKHDPHKPDIRRLLTGYETIISAFTSNGGLIYSSLASLNSDLEKAANSMAWVLGDAVVANNGVYQKQGESNTGSWVRVSDLPFSFIVATDVGGGTPDAIQATTSIPVSGSALVWLSVFEANTGSPVTVSFNGGAPLTIKTNSGNDPVSGGLAGILLGIVSGTTFRLVSDQASASIIAAAEGWANAANDAADRAENAAAGVEYPVSYVAQSLSTAQRGQARANIGLGVYATLTELQASTVASGVSHVKLLERTAGKGGGARWKVETSEPNVPALAKTQDAAGTWLSLSPDGFITPEMLGGLPLISCEAETKAWYDACSVKPTYLHLMHMDRTIRFLKWRGLWSKITQFLSVGGEAQADAGINIKSPGTKNATISGGGTFTPGVGFLGNGVDGHINVGPWNGLINQNAAFILTAFLPGFGQTGNMVGSVAGTASGISINPSSGTSAVIRLNTTTAITTPRDHRSGTFLISRDSSTEIRVWEDGELLAKVASTSAAVSSDSGTLLRSGTAYVPETIRAFVAGNVALGNSNQDADDLTLIMNWHVDGLAAVVGKGPSCASIGFTSTATNAQRLAAMNQSVELAALLGAKVILGFGTYLVNGTFNACRSGVDVSGVNRRGSIVACGDDFPIEIPLIAPSHFNGGETAYRLQNLTLDMRTTARGIVNGGTVRPGPSAVNTNGSVKAEIFAIDILDPNLHGIDDCNTGELNGSSVREYDPAPTPTKWIAGVPSRDNMISDIRCWNIGDDAVTAHYSNGRNGYIRTIEGYWASGRNGLEAATVVEIDDGAAEYNVDGVYGRGLHGVMGVKNHVPCPSPRRCVVKNVVGERSGRLLYLGDGNMIGRNQHSIGELKLSRPWTPAYATESCRPVTIWVVSDISISDFSMVARGDANEGAPLYSVFQFANGVKRVRISHGSILNWKARSDLTTPAGATIRTDNTSEDLSLSDISITGAGVYGIYDTGSVRPDYDRITLSGTGTAASYPIRISTKVSQTTRAIKVADSYSAGVSGFANASDV